MYYSPIEKFASSFLFLAQCSLSDDDYGCKKTPASVCDSKSLFRNLDGSCNNLNDTTLGQAFRCHYRFTEANYPDYYGANISNARLKNVRELSNAFFAEKDEIDSKSKKVNSLWMSFGQMLG
ncbi:Heme peroxidase-like protein, partial [Leptotrombidium deliense]